MGGASPPSQCTSHFTQHSGDSSTRLQLFSCFILYSLMQFLVLVHALYIAHTLVAASDETEYQFNQQGEVEYNSANFIGSFGFGGAGSHDIRLSISEADESTSIASTLLTVKLMSCLDSSRESTATIMEAFHNAPCDARSHSQVQQSCYQVQQSYFNQTVEYTRVEYQKSYNQAEDRSFFVVTCRNSRSQPEQEGKVRITVDFNFFSSPDDRLSTYHRSILPLLYFSTLLWITGMGVYVSNLVYKFRCTLKTIPRECSCVRRGVPLITSTDQSHLLIPLLIVVQCLHCLASSVYWAAWNYGVQGETLSSIFSRIELYLLSLCTGVIILVLIASPQVSQLSPSMCFHLSFADVVIVCGGILCRLVSYTWDGVHYSSKLQPQAHMSITVYHALATLLFWIYLVVLLGWISCKNSVAKSHIMNHLMERSSSEANGERSASTEQQSVQSTLHRIWHYHRRLPSILWWFCISQGLLVNPQLLDVYKWHPWLFSVLFQVGVLPVLLLLIVHSKDISQYHRHHEAISTRTSHRFMTHSGSSLAAVSSVIPDITDEGEALFVVHNPDDSTAIGITVASYGGSTSGVSDNHRLRTHSSASYASISNVHIQPQPQPQPQAQSQSQLHTPARLVRSSRTRHLQTEVEIIHPQRRDLTSLATLQEMTNGSASEA